MDGEQENRGCCEGCGKHLIEVKIDFLCGLCRVGVERERFEDGNEVRIRRRNRYNASPRVMFCPDSTSDSCQGCGETSAVHGGQSPEKVMCQGNMEWDPPCGRNEWYERTYRQANVEWLVVETYARYRTYDFNTHRDNLAHPSYQNRKL